MERLADSWRRHPPGKRTSESLAGSTPVLSAMEGTAKWLATGFETRGEVILGRSIRLPSAIFYSKPRKCCGRTSHCLCESGGSIPLLGSNYISA